MNDEIRAAPSGLELVIMAHAMGRVTGREAGLPKARAALAAVLCLAAFAAQPAMAVDPDAVGAAAASRTAPPGRTANPLDAPPPLPPADGAGSSAPGAAGAALAAPPAVTRPAPPAVPQPVPLTAAPGGRGTAVAGAAAALPDDAVDDPIPPAREVSPEPQIEQVHNGRRVAEVIVVPAGTNLRYTLVNRESQRPSTSSPLNTTSNLSTQRFFRVDF